MKKGEIKRNRVLGCGSPLPLSMDDLRFKFAGGLAPSKTRRQIRA